ncbi:alpha/beta hydrolase [Providencia sp. 21OH12SH02B-Prov]|uniref:alpha/beta fold hydrolase n=1 Tax=Providencia sp. 21OH12SH02B-Prov TaxID=3015951 RepID=UPI0022B60F35|nr:alpha/beta hydrolase [Providencia sp. 21OH12SH02B-Prov]WBA58214.1 alpha/beta hydrolase [Providencia sp. 21OH12SH02B-Prov]
MYTRQLTTTRHNSLQLPDGRHLSWYESGPKTGFPVIFCTGAGMSGTLGFGIEFLNRFGLRLIVPERAGLGDSSQDPQKSLSRFAADIAVLLHSQQIKHYSVIGFSQGAVFAMALAFYGTPNALSIVSGQDQFEHPATRERLRSDVINMQEQAINSPEALADWLKKNVSAPWLLAFILNCSAEIDQQLYHEATFLEAYTECMNRAFVQGNLGYVQDLLITLQAWPFQPEQIQCSVSLWYGQKDESSVHSPDFGHILATRFPHCQHFLFKNEGGSLLWTQSEAILKNLKAE